MASSLTTVSARSMLTAMINGERDPRVLADLARGRMRVKIPQLTEALIGHFDANHARLARSILARLDAVEAALAELDAVLREAFTPWARQIELMQTIPGVGEKVAQVIIAETGADMSRFPSAAHLAAWGRSGQRKWIVGSAAIATRIGGQRRSPVAGTNLMPTAPPRLLV